MVSLQRGDIFSIFFPYTLDPKYPNGKNKLVLVLQDGEYFTDYSTVVVLLITSVSKNKDKYEATDVEVPRGSTKLYETSYIDCSQPYTIPKRLFNGKIKIDKLRREVLDEIDMALYFGLCFDKQNEIANINKIASNE